MELKSDATERQPLIFRVLAVLALGAGLLFAYFSSPPANYQVEVDAKLTDTTSVYYRFSQKHWEGSCPIAAQTLEDSISEACIGCEITSRCVTGDSRQSASGLQAATLAFGAGVATFVSDSGDAAMSICNVSRTAMLGSDESGNCSIGIDTRQASRSLSLHLAIPGVALILILTIVGLSIAQRAGMGEIERTTTGHRQASSILTALSDVMAIYLSWLSVALGSGGYLEMSSYNALGNQVALGGSWLMALLHFYRDHYCSRFTLHTELGHLVGAIFVLGLLHSTLATLAGNVDPITPAIFWATTLLCIPTSRYLLRAFLDDRNLWRRPALIIGRGENAEAARMALLGDFTLGYKTLRLDSSPVLKRDSSDFCELDNLASDVHKAKEVASKVKIVAALDSLQSEEAQKILSSLLELDRKIEVIPSLRGLPALGADVSQFFGHELIMLSIQNKLAKRPQRFFKRTFDLVISSLLLVLLSPLFLYLMIRIRADGGSAFFQQDRVGREGAAFKCYKFRSMYMDAESRLDSLLSENPGLKSEWQRNFKLASDPRVTSIGRTIRKYSLDELPQLINVLRGEMSLVGPRPLLFNELERYGDAIALYELVSPGITGVWQVSGRSDTSFEQRREMDEWYIRNWSLYYDLSCLLRTIGVVTGSRGAY